MKKKLLDKLKHKENRRGWKQGQVARMDYVEIVQTGRDQVRKDKAKLKVQVNMDRDIKGKKKRFFRYIGDKRKTSENVGPL